jgi:competence protein ComEC
MGGLPAVLRNFHPGELWVGKNPRFGAYEALLKEADRLHVRVRALRAGDSLTLGSAQIGVLAPGRHFQAYRRSSCGLLGASDFITRHINCHA